MYYICVTYTWGSSFFFFGWWNYTRKSYVQMRVILHISILYNTSEKWKCHLSQRPLILLLGLFWLFFFWLRGLLWLSGIVWFCLHELKSSSPLLVSGKKIKKSLTLFIGIEKGDFLKLFCIKEMKIKFPKNILHKRK